MYYERARGADPGPAVEPALSAIQRAVEHLPDAAAPRANLGMVHALVASFELEAGRDPEPSLSRAFPALAEALARDPEDRQSHLYLGEAKGTLALSRAKKGRFLAADFDEAEREYRRAIELAPEDQSGRVAFGHFWRMRAAAERAAGQDPLPSSKRGLEIAGGLLAVRPDWAEARALRASLWLQEAEGGPAADRRTAAEKALTDFEAAFAASSNLEARFRGQAALARRLATTWARP